MRLNENSDSKLTGSPESKYASAEITAKGLLSKQMQHSLELLNTLEQAKPNLKRRNFPPQHPGQSSELEEGKVTVNFRKNKIVKPYVKFDISPFKNVFNPDRMLNMVAKDALLWPSETFDPVTDPLKYRDPGQPDLGKRSTRLQGLKDKTITDYANRPIYKFDRLHGALNGGLYMQTTHGRNPVQHQSQGERPRRNSTLIQQAAQ